MATQESSVGREESNVSCSCKSTCSTKQTSTTSNRGCPCKTKGVICTSQCKCGSQTKPCRNKSTAGPSGTTSSCPVPRQQNNNYNVDRPTEEEERIKENQDVKAFIKTLDQRMIRKLCVRSLQRGVGSMDHIYSLLIMEDEDDSDQEDDGADQCTPLDPETMLGGASLPAHNPEPPSPSETSLPWCKCGVCTVMPQEIENKCCRQRKCVTSFARFSKLCLDPDVLQLCIRNRVDIRNDRDDNSTRAFRKAAYRQFILDRYGYLGKGNRKVCPACVVKTVRHHYPSQTGVYMGYRPE